MTEETATYAYNYNVLSKECAKLEQDSDKPEMIDELAELLKNTSESYKMCKDRIDAAQKYIDEFNKSFPSQEGEFGNDNQSY